MKIDRSSTEIALTSLIRANGGAVLVEFAFLVPILLLLVGGAVELGRYAMEYSRVASAARAGVQYGIQDQSTASDMSGIARAVREDAGDTGNQLQVTARRYCQCPGDAGETDCTAVCSDASYAPMYVDVTVSKRISPLFPYLALQMLSSVAANGSARVR